MGVAAFAVSVVAILIAGCSLAISVRREQREAEDFRRR
jgi:hypothetical protein